MYSKTTCEDWTDYFRTKHILDMFAISLDLVLIEIDNANIFSKVPSKKISSLSNTRPLFRFQTSINFNLDPE